MWKRKITITNWIEEIRQSLKEGERAEPNYLLDHLLEIQLLTILSISPPLCPNLSMMEKSMQKYVFRHCSEYVFDHRGVARGVISSMRTAKPTCILCEQISCYSPSVSSTRELGRVKSSNVYNTVTHNFLLDHLLEVRLLSVTSRAYEITNVVTTFNLENVLLDIRKICQASSFFEFNPKNFAAATGRLNHPTT